LALCAKERGDLESLGRRCDRLRIIAGGREKVLHDRWMVEAAYAWDLCLNRARPEEAASRLDVAERELRRRDVSHWLRLELEAIRLEEYVEGGIAVDRRRRLASLAQPFGALGIVRGARERLPCSDGAS